MLRFRLLTKKRFLSSTDGSTVLLLLMSVSLDEDDGDNGDNGVEYIFDDR